MPANDLYMAATDSLVTEHPPKRLRLYSEEDTMINEEEYEEAVQVLQDEYNNKKKNKKGSNHKIIKDLMEKTKKRRHQWIRQDRPMVTEVLNKFPVLRTSRWVS